MQSCKFQLAESVFAKAVDLTIAKTPCNEQLQTGTLQKPSAGVISKLVHEVLFFTLRKEGQSCCPIPNIDPSRQGSEPLSPSSHIAAMCLWLLSTGLCSLVQRQEHSVQELDKYLCWGSRERLPFPALLQSSAACLCQAQTGLSLSSFFWHQNHSIHCLKKSLHLI